jgi:curved DNA-binding protein CbpA
MTCVDHYETLEVSRNASPAVIRAAYKSLMQRLHPDKHPEDEANAGRAAHIASAYEVLSNPERRAAYDIELRRNPGPGMPVSDGPRPSPESVERQASRRGTRRPVKGGAVVQVGQGGSAWQAALASRSGIGWLVFVCVMAAGAVWVFAQWSPKKSDPRTELASIRQAFASAEVTEEKRLALFARKLDILAQQPGLVHAENAEKAEEMAARTFALLQSPLVVRVGGATSGVGGPVAELTIESISVLVGTFDAQRHLAHMANHRERLVSALSERLAKQDPGRLASPQAGVVLNKVMLDSMVATLGTDPAQIYPSTYFESPGRYGVVDLVLPAQFKLVQLGAAPQ